MVSSAVRLFGLLVLAVSRVRLPSFTAREWVALPASLMMFCLLSCDVFDEGRIVSGDYALYKPNVNGPYHLFRRFGSHDGTGVLDGAVVRIGWCDSYVWALRERALGGYVDGWMVVSVRDGVILGPISRDSAAMVVHDSGCSDSLWSVSAAEAWKLCE